MYMYLQDRIWKNPSLAFTLKGLPTEKQGRKVQSLILVALSYILYTMYMLTYCSGIHYFMLHSFMLLCDPTFSLISFHAKCI